MKKIPFNQPFLVGTELAYVREAAEDGALASGGAFTARCEGWLADTTGAERALLSHSGTGALEAAMMLAGLGPGDEAIMPSFAYPTMATAVVRQGATPVFADVDPRTLNLDPAGGRGGGWTPNQGNRRRALRRRRLRDGRAARNRRAGRPGRDRGRGALSPRRATGAALWARSATSGPSASTTPRTSPAARAARSWSTIRRCWREPRSSGRRGPTASASSAAKSIATPGSTSAHRSRRARSPPPSSGGSWRRRRRSPRGGSQIWGRYHEAFAELEAEGLAQRPQVPDGHRTTAISTT